MPNSDKTGISAQLKRNLLRGLLIITPIAVVAIVVSLAYGFIDGWFGPVLAYFVRLLVPASWLGPFTSGNIPGLSVIFTFVFLVVTGWIGSWHVGRKGLSIIDHVFLAIPGIRIIYSAARKAVDALGDSSKSTFQRAVWVNWGLGGTKVLAFVTAETTDLTTGRKYLVVVLASPPPNPAGGAVATVPEDQATDTGLTMDEALKMAMSLGVLTPKTIRINSEK